jgi:hypothetical protein
MALKAALIKPFAHFMAARQKRWAANPLPTQAAVFANLVQKGGGTQFGTEHKLAQVSNHAEFAEAIPLRDYEGFLPYIERIKQGQHDVLWPGRPLYFAKTSGTTSGTKYIPITKDSAPNHVNSAVNSVLSYISETGSGRVMDHQILYLSGSPELEREGDILVGRLSGIVNHHIPLYLQRNKMPSVKTNTIDDWEQKVDAIVEETLKRSLGLISGIPPWVQMYFDKIVERTGKRVMDVFPHFNLLVYGGVNFEPYAKRLFDTIGRRVDTIETYPASEGFLAYQDSQKHEGMLLLLDSGIYYEFVTLEELDKPMPKRLPLAEVSLGVNYAIVINSNAGLWGYVLGDTVRFVSLRPYRIVVTGRTKHFISAFGEHVISEEVDKALANAMLYHPEVKVTEYSVAPNVSPKDGLPRHEWFIEFSQPPANMPAFERRLDEQMCKVNSYYNDLVSGRVLEPLQIIQLRQGAFIDYMKRIGKLGGQNKVPRLANNRNLADQLMEWA